AAIARAEAFSHARRARHRAELLLSLRQGKRLRNGCWPYFAFTPRATNGKNPQPRRRALAPATLELEGGRQFSLRRCRDWTVRRCDRRGPRWRIRCRAHSDRVGPDRIRTISVDLQD